jgi:hypothetical protein
LAWALLSQAFGLDQSAVAIFGHRAAGKNARRASFKAPRYTLARRASNE